MKSSRTIWFQGTGVKLVERPSLSVRTIMPLLPSLICTVASKAPERRDIILGSGRARPGVWDVTTVIVSRSLVTLAISSTHLRNSWYDSDHLMSLSMNMSEMDETMIVEGARLAGARGVIAHVMKFCDPYLARMPVIQSVLREASLPLLLLEGDCTTR